ncbi:Protein CHLOROPLAST IMPORT APPARATUS 2 [Platanthera guangdongensis]|uniref:Protein CHLOROPLAST IMPORT APPARATUS 2 n=1 Tax=Platanthera guangdongensis TaxID=2320717 RepID=A0ABR2LY87_9ASPA
MPSSPTFPMSSCLTGSGVRSYGMDLDIVVKSSSPSVCTSNSSPSSTLSESSNSTPLFISTKRARAPRKRPNQCSDEAAALLSSIYPNLFSATNLRQQSFHRRQPQEDPFPVLLPSFQISSVDPGLLLHDLPSPVKPPIELNLAKADDARIHSLRNFQFQCPDSPDFDAESILDEEVEEGIDSIMGNLSVSRDSNGDFPNSNSNSILTPYLANLMRFGFGGGFRFEFGISSNMSGALRQSNDGEWWRSPTVAVKEFVPKFDEPPPKKLAMADKKKRKKKKKVEKDEAAVEREDDTAVSSPEEGILKPQLGLKLNYESVLNEWTGPPPCSDETGLPESAADVAVRA